MQMHPFIVPSYSNQTNNYSNHMHSTTSIVIVIAISIIIYIAEMHNIPNVFLLQLGNNNSHIMDMTVITVYTTAIYYANVLI